MENAASLLPIVAIAVIFWLLVIRPASRQRKAAAELQAALSVGDDVVLTSGIFGTIVGLADDGIELQVAPGVVIRVVRGAVGSVRRDLDELQEGDNEHEIGDSESTGPDTDDEER